MPTVRMRGSRPARARLVARVLGVTLLVVSPLCSMASESDRSVGAHEVPPFVCDRVELAHDLAVNGLWREPWSGELAQSLYGARVPGALCRPRIAVLRSYG